MLSASTTTLIYLGRERLVRCDVSASGRQRGCWTRPRPAGLELPGLVDVALHAGSPRPRIVWVLAADFWTQSVALACDAAKGLSPAETARLLAFEMESLSGLAALDAEVGHAVTRDDGRQREYWTVQAPTWVRDQIDAIVRQAGGRLEGMLHPGGLPVPVSTVDGQRGSVRWMRIEAWPGAVVAVGTGEDGRLQHHVGQADSRGAALGSELSVFLQSFAHVELVEQLADAGLSPPLAEDQPIVRLDRDEQAAAWLVRWASVLKGRALVVPVIRPRVRPASRAALLAAGMAVAALVGAFATWDVWSTGHEIETLQADTKELQRQRTALEGATKLNATLEKQLTDERKLVERVRAVVDADERVLTAHRRRWPRLLESLALHCPPEAAISEITADTHDNHAGRTLIRGTSLEPVSVDRLAAALSRELRDDGWLAAPIQKTIAPTPNGGGMCRFVIELRDMEPAQAGESPKLIEPTTPGTSPAAPKSLPAVTAAVRQ